MGEIDSSLSGGDGLNRIEVRSYYVRKRHALAVRAAFGPLYEDYYLHWMQHGIRLDPGADDLLKSALAALVLHLASRPQDELSAWTLNFQDPLLNLFVTGATRPGNVTGRVWTEGVRKSDHGLMHVETLGANGRHRRSSVLVDRADIWQAAEAFYLQSEQRPARFFEHGPDDMVMVTAQPECDVDWLNALDAGAIRRLDRDEELALLETRGYFFDCGCNADRIAGRLAILSSTDRDRLFDGDPSVRVDCPRCGAGIQIDRATVEKHAAIGEDSRPQPSP